MQPYVDAMQPGVNYGNTYDAAPNETSWGNAAITQALKDKAVVDALALVGLVANGTTAQDMAADQKAEYERWGPLVKQIGFTSES